jgi:hypothetical protein
MKSYVVTNGEIIFVKSGCLRNCFTIARIGYVFQRAIVDIIGHQCVTCVSQIISQGCITEGSVTGVQELLDVAIGKECFDLFFRINP